MIGENKDRKPAFDYRNIEKPSNEFLCWFAGFFEGDGHVSKHEKYALTITQTKSKGLKQCKEIQDRFGGIGRINEDNREYGKECHATCYRWSISHPKAIEQILRWIQPYLDVNTKASDMLDHFGIEETVPIWEQKQYYTEDALNDSLEECSQNAVKIKQEIQDIEAIKNEPELVDLREPNLIQSIVKQSSIDVSLNELRRAVSSSTQYGIKKLKDQGLWDESMGLCQDQMEILDVEDNCDSLVVTVTSKKPLNRATISFSNMWLEDNECEEIKIKSEYNND